MIVSLTPAPVTSDRFDAYGTVVSEVGHTPTHTEAGFSWWDRLASIGATGSSLGIVKAKTTGSLEQTVFERHLQTTEILIPLDGSVYLVLGRPGVTPVDIDPDAFGAFLVPEGTLVSLNPGVWHRAPIVEDSPVRVVILFAAGTGDHDIEFMDLAQHDHLVRVAP